MSSLTRAVGWLVKERFNRDVGGKHRGVNQQERREDAPSKLDRELIELLNELRVLLPGVQVLFAFLLTVPFSARFEQTTPRERAGYYVAFVFALLSSVLLSTPSVYHRVQFRQGDKERLMRVGNAVTLAGSVCLMMALAATVFFVTGFLATDAVGFVAAAIATVSVAGLWWILPVARRGPHHRSGEPRR